MQKKIALPKPSTGATYVEEGPCSGALLSSIKYLTEMILDGDISIYRLTSDQWPVAVTT